MKSFGNIVNAVKRWSSMMMPSFVILAILVLWELSVYVTGIEKWILPAPTDIFQSLINSSDLLVIHSLQTLKETLLGLLLAVIIGIILATLIDVSKWFRKALYPLLVISQTIPIIAVAPLIMIWFGFGILPKVIVVALVCFFPIAINLADGYRTVDITMIRLLETMGATKWQIFKMVKLPGAMPFFFSGLRIAGTYSVMGAVIGEWLGASQGLGILLTRSSQSFLTDRVFATIIVIVFMSLAVFAIVEALARVTMRWHYQQKNKD
ncbi:ABC-type nitrate/sulfonate/bicarbonate transport system permease component [Anoxybacillus vitaminiphilus]|uniref:ABC-type nitrate/sulfonate/bicarbonate transport system permease component n=1 Tax=Paranoxybacillus vitaminiphilus TaxID=581036 RepID=A0A327YKB3_9BACL|nr:ABC transporter permease [Anoxybacillus vitaminiphilus]RAK18719.1 ABC-type nitrate/sulfonate/bicarbonate transport system permease component [Anoxybacillus vitaminiphilus]